VVPVDPEIGLKEVTTVGLLGPVPVSTTFFKYVATEGVTALKNRKPVAASISSTEVM
jgi:hypothetical protein